VFLSIAIIINILLEFQAFIALVKNCKHFIASIMLTSSAINLHTSSDCMPYLGVLIIIMYALLKAFQLKEEVVILFEEY
jgi:hypothetical protein